MFEYFWETSETIIGGVGFELFKTLHLLELLTCLVIVVLVNKGYKKANEKTRDKYRKIIALLALLDEAYKQFGLIYSGHWDSSYLPLHLCSINIFVIFYHAFFKKKSNMIGNFLYALCMPGALIALLTPTWTALPFFNFMHLHSVSVHLLLFMYPLILLLNKDIIRDYRYIPKIFIILFIIAVPIFFLNKVLDSNYLFLASPPKGTPLELFEKLFGNHLIGYLIFVPIVLLLEYIPFKKINKV